MKITMRTADLARALYRVQGIADRKSTQPMLAHVLLTAQEPHTLTVSATDTDLSLVGTYEAMVGQSGGVAVHARQLYDIVKALSEETVELLGQANHWLDIRAGNSRFHLVGAAPDEFPSLPEPEAAEAFALQSTRLAQMIDRTLFCVSTDENRHNLSGIFVQTPAPGSLRMVATDGHRLAMAEGQFDAPVHLPQGVIVPRKGVQEIKRILHDCSDLPNVGLCFSGNSVALQAGSLRLATRLIEGQFPDYEQVIPKTGNKKATLAKVAFAEALRRVSLLSQGRAHGVRFAFSEGSLQMVAEDPDFGDAQETMAVQYSGEPLMIGFNARYILDVLALIGEAEVAFQLADDLSPAVMRPVDDASFLAVVMPMRI